jgi:hypothetical protein
MPKGTPKPDADLTLHHPYINEMWFVERLKEAAGPLHAEHYNRWACEHLGRMLGKKVSQSVLTRRLKGRKKWPLDFTVAMAKLLRVDLDVVLLAVGNRVLPPK